MCHSVASLRFPVVLSFQWSVVATLKLVTLPPLGKFLVSGLRPNTPITIVYSRLALLILTAYKFAWHRKPSIKGAPRRHRACSPVRVGWK